MPNILGHLKVASNLRPDEIGYITASAIPDFAGMISDESGKRLLALESFDASENPDLVNGVRLHKDTDRIYNRSPRKTELNVALRKDLEIIAPRMGRGAIMSCADAGTEILMDGVLFYDKQSRAVYDEVREAVLRSDLTDRFVELLGISMRQYFEADIPLKYGNPRSVAKMLHRRLAVRNSSLTMFDTEHIPDLTRALGTHIYRLNKVSVDIIDGLTETLKESETLSL